MDTSVASEVDWHELWGRSNERTTFTSWDYHKVVQPEAVPVLTLIRGRPLLGAWISKNRYPFAAYQGLLTSLSDYSLRKQLLLVYEFVEKLVDVHGHFTMEIG